MFIVIVTIIIHIYNDEWIGAMVFNGVRPSSRWCNEPQQHSGLLPQVSGPIVAGVKVSGKGGGLGQQEESSDMKSWHCFNIKEGFAVFVVK